MTAEPESPARSGLSHGCPTGRGGNVNGVLRVIVDGQGLDMWQNARLFVLTNIAINDTLVATLRAKCESFGVLTRRSARSTTEIRKPDPIPNGLPTSSRHRIRTGLPSTVGAGTEVIRDFFGTDEVPFTITVAGIPPRSYSSLSQAVDESAPARVYGGIHFRTGCVKAIELGEQVGKFVFNTHLRPLR